MASRGSPSSSSSACFVGSDVVILIFAQARWTKLQAKAWAKKRGFRHGSIADVQGRWILRQNDPARFAQGSFRQTHVDRDVHAMVGCPK